MEKLIDKIRTLKSKEDFIAFLELLVQDFKNNPDEWKNKKIDSYFEAAASWTEDMDGYYRNNNLPIPENIDWSIFANILIAAKMYE